jgi:mRNA interferase RelE/StbE
MAWRIEFERTAERELAKLDPQTARRILIFLNERLAPSTDPRRLGEALHGNLAAYWKYRVGDYESSRPSRTGCRGYWLCASAIATTSIGNRNR